MTIARSVFEAAIRVKALRRSPERVADFAEFGFTFVDRTQQAILTNVGILEQRAVGRERFDAASKMKAKNKWHQESIKQLAESVGFGVG